MAQEDAEAGLHRVEADVAAVAVRVGAMGSALDQLRLSLLAALDRVADSVDHPAWWPELQGAFDQLSPSQQNELRQALAVFGARVEQAVAEQPGPAPVLAAIAELRADRRLNDLISMVGRLVSDPRLGHLTVTVDRLSEDRRLDELAAAVASLTDGLRAGALATALEHLGERLTAVEAATDRFGEDARTLVDWVAPLHDRLGAIAAQVDRITPLARAGDDAGSLMARLDRVTAGLEQVAGPSGEEALLDRMDQGERSLAASLDRLEQQGQALASQLAWVSDRLAEVTADAARIDDLPEARAAHVAEVAAVAADAAADRFDSMIGVLAGVARRQDELAASVDRRLSAVETGLEALRAAARPASGPSASAELAALRLAELRAERAQVQALLREERLLAAQPWVDDDVDDKGLDEQL